MFMSVAARPSTPLGRGTVLQAAANQTAAQDRLAHHEPLRPADAGSGAELRVAALDELAKKRCVQTCGHHTPVQRRLKLTGVAVERCTFLIVLRAHVDHE